MDYVLLDIKNFLKKLENGQLEIEAGQWELHKDLTNMRLAIGEIKNMKEDVEKMRLNSVQQMNLIKVLQDKIEKLNQGRMRDQPLTVSERSIKYEKVYRRPNNGVASTKGYKKRKNHLIRSEEIIEITSQMSKEKSDSDQEESNSKESCSKSGFEEPILKASKTYENPNNSECGSVESLYREAPHNVPSQSKSNDMYSCSTTNDILQRYLIDSAKYVERKRSSAAEVICKNSGRSRSEKSLPDVEYMTFWDEYGCSRTEENTEHMKQNPPPKENSSDTLESKTVMAKTFECPKCLRKFPHKADLLRHEREHQKAEAVRYCKICGKGFCGKHRLREHEAIHKIPSKGSKGFKCSYCNKICSTPETLTSHLKKCRVIKRHNFKRK